ncbi:cytochrome P450 [Aspergillus eucalypticola CBS 122712]|uniref:Cytochrome P450 n=1 Tax=Aspergillus eucalypticola (strain CBS 122712 / IBT 29274) TaxID=1448314 RepID=A0A317WGS9_ASPEC|nr:cytochrome P450 [Aspergillus eucalypticola CBS 122712]PWY84258.1 cytochrome P450 [Aspergillus eucalypticola CBS 122712]
MLLGVTLAADASTLLCIGLITVAIYRLTVHRLAHVPGPWIFCISSIPQWIIVLLGTEPQTLAYCHRPESASNYVANAGFMKDGRYRNFDVNGQPTIYSAIDKAYRDKRAKAVLSLFAPVRIREAAGAQNVQQYIQQFIARLASYMFDKSYGALNEAVNLNSRSPPTKFSESAWLQVIAAFGYYSMFPTWLFSRMLSLHLAIQDRLWGASMRRTEPTTPAHTYRGRLRTAGVTEDEVIGICEGSLFAGTSSTGQTLATILFHLVRHALVRKRLHQEVGISSSPDLQSLPYLRSVITEGLRLAMTNPAPLIRAVPDGGCHIDGVYLPGRISVGASIYVFHHDPDVFPNSFAFSPERWLADETDCATRELCYFPFGLGSRSCIRRNLALQELYEAVAAIVKTGVLEGASTCEEKIIVNGCFNGEVQGHAIDIHWPIRESRSNKVCM